MTGLGQGFQRVDHSSDKDTVACQYGGQPMETRFEAMEQLFFEKIILYQELVECLKEERKLLIKTDMDALWEISEKKQAIAPCIEAVRKKMLETLSEGAIDHHMDGASFSLTTVLSLIPREERERFRKPYLSLVNLKAETRQRSQENKRFVEKSLDFLDELIGILSSAGGSSDMYTDGGVSSNKSHANILLHKEV
jgi:flagellar biosynthesis/type III secretory pathway chaperone